MNNKTKPARYFPEDWGLEIGHERELIIGGCSTVDLADEYSTPLHVVNEQRLSDTATGFLNAFKARYPGKVTVHFAFKCNPVPGVIETIRSSGFGAEVMTVFEFHLARRIGFKPDEIIVNGPFKPDTFLSECTGAGVRLIIVDSLRELRRIGIRARDTGRTADILLRINPDYVPRGMNRGTATGSRKGCAFGLDMKGGEPLEALTMLKDLPWIHFRGFHFHIGTGIYDPEDYTTALVTLRRLIKCASENQFEIQIMDIGGGFASRTTREMTTREMLIYQGWERLPSLTVRSGPGSFKDYASAISTGMEMLFPQGQLPELLLEPGRCIISPNQILLLKVHQVKERKGLKKWLITDGGIGTVTMPTFYENHEIFLCNDVYRQETEPVTICGPGCFAADVVYRNKPMPVIAEGDVLAVMDSGAYFTSWESNFGHPRPAVVAVKEGRSRLLRRRETDEDMLSRDILPNNS